MRVNYTWEAIERWRDRIHRRRPALAVSTKRQALTFINAVGFCFAFKSENSELPSLWHATCGARDPVMPLHTHHDPAISFVWEMKDVLPAEREIYYGKLLKSRPTMVSLDLLPHFYVLAGRTGSRSEFLAEFSRGRLSGSARAIMQALSEESPQPTKGLKLATGLHTRGDRVEFDRAIAELQTKMYIVKVGEQADPFAFLWAPFTKAFPAVVRRSARITPERAREVILTQYFRNQLVGTVESIHRLFRWPRREIFQTLGRLVQTGIVATGVKVEGRDHRYYCLVGKG